MANTQKGNADKFSDKEAQQRFESALRGARLAKPSQLKDIPKKSGESRSIGRKKAKKKRL